NPPLRAEPAGTQADFRLPYPHKTHAKGPATPCSDSERFRHGFLRPQRMTPFKSNHNVRLAKRYKLGHHPAGFVQEMCCHGLFGRPGAASEIIPSWKQVSNVQDAGSGTPQLSTRPREVGRATWKTARSAASRMCCVLSTMPRRTSSSSRPNWSRYGPRTADLGLQTSDLRIHVGTRKGQRSAVACEILLGCLVKAS